MERKVAREFRHKVNRQHFDLFCDNNVFKASCVFTGVCLPGSVSGVGYTSEMFRVRNVQALTLETLYILKQNVFRCLTLVM